MAHSRPAPPVDLHAPGQDAAWSPPPSPAGNPPWIPPYRNGLGRAVFRRGSGRGRDTLSPLRRPRGVFDSPPSSPGSSPPSPPATISPTWSPPGSPRFARRGVRVWLERGRDQSPLPRPRPVVQAEVQPVIATPESRSVASEADIKISDSSNRLAVFACGFLFATAMLGSFLVGRYTARG